MMRITAGAFAAMLMVASPALAQVSAENMDSQAQTAGVNFATSSDADIDAALTSQLQADIVASSGVDGATDIAQLTDEQLAAAVGTILENNPSLTTKQVTALVRAAIRSRPAGSPGIAMIAYQAAYARPDIAKEIQVAAISVAPALSQQIVAQTVRGAVSGVEEGRAEETNVSDS